MVWVFSWCVRECIVLGENVNFFVWIVVGKESFWRCCLLNWDFNVLNWVVIFSLEFDNKVF